MLELNVPGVYEVTSIRHEMGRAATLTFFKISEDPDNPTPDISLRTEVKFTVNGVVWFLGWTLPGRRSIAAGREVLEYTAADALEFMGNNPCANDGLGESEWYNRNAVDVTAFAWPSNQTVREIIEAELASLVGVGGSILAGFDFTLAGTAADVVPTEFQTKGKTWLGIVEALVNEAPGLGYWYDPSTLNVSGPSETWVRGTLRFYDLSTAGLNPTRKIARLARRGTPVDGAPATLESAEISEDISQSYDRVIVRGWGDMQERYETASPAWTALSASAYGDGGRYLRHNQTTGKVEAFVPALGGGTWEPEDTLSPRPWFPESAAPDYKNVGRRFSVTHGIADLRITRKDSTSPAVYQRDPQSMWVFTLQHVWNLGTLQWFSGSTLHVGYLIADVKIADYSAGIVDDDGSVKPNEQLYGDPVTGTEPRFLLPTPSAYDTADGTGYFVLKEHLFRRTQYLFLSASGINANLANVPCFKFYPTYDYVWFKYTATDVLQEEAANLGLGYEKTLLLYDQRLVKYTDIDGNVLRDDSPAMASAAAAVFALVSRLRVYGTLLVHQDPATVWTDWPMGALVRLNNWGSDGADYDVAAPVQGFDLSRCRDEWRVTLRLDRENTFRPLERMIQAMEFFEGDSVVGEAGLQGRRGHRMNPNPRPKAKKPEDVGGGSAPATFNNNSITEDPPTGPAIVRGVITARTAARDVCDVLGYTAETADGVYATLPNSRPALRNFSEGTVVFAAEIGSTCTIELVPRGDNSGIFDARLLSVHERAHEWKVLGHVTDRSAATGLPPGILYDWVSDDGVWSGADDRPLYAPYNDAPLVDAAEVGSECTIIIKETATGSPLSYTYEARLWAVQEKLHFEECDTDSFAYNPGDGELDPDAFVVTDDGEVVVDDNGEVVYAEGYGWPEGVEPAIVVSADFKLVFDDNGNAVTAQQDAVNPTYWDPLVIASDDFNAVTSLEGTAGIVGPPTSIGGGGEEN